MILAVARENATGRHILQIIFTANDVAALAGGAAMELDLLDEDNVGETLNGITDLVVVSVPNHEDVTAAYLEEGFIDQNTRVRFGKSADPEL